MEDWNDLGNSISECIEKTVKQALKNVKINLKGLENFNLKNDFCSEFEAWNPLSEDFGENLADTIASTMECITDIIEKVTDSFDNLFE